MKANGSKKSDPCPNFPESNAINGILRLRTSDFSFAFCFVFNCEYIRPANIKE